MFSVVVTMKLETHKCLRNAAMLVPGQRTWLFSKIVSNADV